MNDQSKMTTYGPRERKALPWDDYPIGTKAHALMGGHWLKVRTHGWQWRPNGSMFPTPGGDAFDVSVPKERANVG